ncbi:MAG TPA: EAL domain-containing protein [Rhodocyclaceae bacterium]|nr:EAL domain-containing protein [Rhodocyclaceae bacterium]
MSSIEKPELTPDGDSLFVGRQPILDHKQGLVAYELLFRDSHENAANVNDALSATATVITNAFGELGIEQVLGPYKGFINCDAAMLLSDLPELLPADRIVLEVLENVEATPEIIERCTELKARGFTIAVDDFTYELDRWQRLLPLTDIVKVDLLQLSSEQLTETTHLLRQYPLKLLAEKVDTGEAADTCRNLGYNFFQGYYFARPSMLTGQKLGQSQAALLKLMAMVLQDVETRELENAIKQQPGLAFNLLRLTNSVAMGLRLNVTSLRHAITILGRRQLQRWLQLAIYSNPNSSSFPSPLMHLAATRGRLIELLAASTRPNDHTFQDHGFLTGIMSLMPSLLGVPMQQVLKGLSLDTGVIDALTEHNGELGLLLSLAESLEQDNIVVTRLLAQRLGLSPGVVNNQLAHALAWVGSLSTEFA